MKRAAVLAVLLLLLASQAAGAHAVLESSQPARAAELERAPQRVTLRFNEPVEVAFGSIRVYDRDGRRVDSGSAEHPRGRGDEIAVALREGLGDGTYTATYRVVSADSHPVAGGFVFSVGEGGAAPRFGVAELIDSGSAGPVTQAAFGVVRGLAYLSIALAAGGLAFALAVWAPALRENAGASGGWRSASECFSARMRTVLLAAAATGALSAALGILLQGATATASSFWSALDPDVVGDLLGTRFGTVWALRLLAWLCFALLVALPLARPAPVLRPASLGATGLAPVGLRPRVGLAAALLLAGFLCLTPALAGHASTVDPSALLVPVNFLHVASMSVWVGGVAALLLVLPAATRRLEPPERGRLLAAGVSRLSTIALFAVAALVASGVLQGIAELQAFADLWETAFGRAIAAKATLVIVLLALGAWNRQRARPRLAERAARGEPPGGTGVILRRTLLAEVGVMLAVLGATAALAAYAPPIAEVGPFAASDRLGPARMELTLDPARAGANQLHLYLFDPRDGSQFDRVKELELKARLPDRRIGPIDLPAEKAGPGHYVVRRADIAPAGDWELELTARVSEFDVYTTKLEIPLR